MSTLTALHKTFAKMQAVATSDADDGEILGGLDGRGGAGAPLARLRRDLVEHLKQLRGELAKELPERETYLLLFPISIFFDEMVQLHHVTGLGGDWQLLQKELFDIDKGGELFFETLDDLLDQQLSPTVYQVYYFCLSLGFRGRHSGNEERITSYKNRLTAHFVDPAALPRLEQQESEEQGYIRPVRSIWWYYLGAAVITVAAYAVLSNIGL